MYKDLSDEIDSLDSQMHADADAYNKDHGMFDGDRIRFYDFW
ncbi:hypothetical protein [Streptococcus criceti]|nr:hypothetical protein [Streptococcus criceti]